MPSSRASPRAQVSAGRRAARRPPRSPRACRAPATSRAARRARRRRPRPRARAGRRPRGCAPFCGRGQLHGGGAHEVFSSPRLTGQSTGSERILCLGRSDPGAAPGAPGPRPRPAPARPHAALRGGRPLKRWRYVGVFGADLMLCVGVRAHRPLGQSAGGRCGTARRAARERTARGRGAGSVSPRARGERRHVASTSSSTTVRRSRWSARTGESTCGRASAAACAPRGCRARGAGTRSTPPAIVDDSAGYHARDTAWAGRRARRTAAGAPSRGTSSPGSTTPPAPRSARSGSTASRARWARCVRRRPAGRRRPALWPRRRARAREPARPALGLRAALRAFSGALPGAGRWPRAAA